MPKPVAGIPLWASDLNYPAGAEPEAGTATKAAPTSGQATIGWRPNQIPTAQEQNYWMDLVADWIAYLDAADIAGNLKVTGNLWVTGTSQLDGAVTAPNYKYTTAQTNYVPAGHAVSSYGHVLDAPTGGFWPLLTITGQLVYPFAVRAGDRITAWRVYIDKISGAGTVTAQLRKFGNTAPGVYSETTIGGIASKATTAGVEAMAISGLTEDVGITKGGYHVVVNGGGTTGDITYHLEVDITRP